MTRISPLVALGALLACTPQPEARDTTPAPVVQEGEGIFGTVAIVGSAPINVQVVLRTADGASVRLIGPLVEELRRLSGVEVAVEGSMTSAPDPIVRRQIEVTDYDIISVDGEPVVMGEIMAIEDGRVRLRTRSGEDVYLSGAPAEFRVGHKVWVQGPRGVVVQSYGTIRP
jgi:hypothetical protein